MAKMLIEVDGAWVLIWRAASMLGEGMPCAKEIGISEAWTIEAYWRVTADAI